MKSTPQFQPNFLVGHGPKWQALARAFAKDSVPQTLLISGALHTGKSTLAWRFAQLLLCPQVVSDENDLPAPCGTCRVCHQVEIETFPDFRVYRPLLFPPKDEGDWVVAPEDLEGGEIYINVARKFGDEAMRRPSVGARKVMILQGADKMNHQAQNALLKTFEEPIKGLTIILLAQNPHELLATVRSRCWHLPLGLASDSAIENWLRAQFKNVTQVEIETAIGAAAGRPGAAKREIERLRGGETSSHFAAASELAERIQKAHPVGALGLSETALNLAKEWWNAEHEALKKADGKVARSSAAHVLDELTKVYRARWKDASNRGGNGESWALGLDQIRKTRHYILSNANTGLALDVMFGRLIALHKNRGA